MRIKSDYIDTMPEDRQPVFRRTIPPWYDSEVACLVMLICMLLVFWFGMIGMVTVRENAEYQDHLGVPLAIVLMSSGVIISITIRLILRYTARLSK